MVTAASSSGPASPQTTGDFVLVKTEAETGDPVAYLDLSPLTGPAWPGHGTTVRGRVLSLPEEGFDLLVINPDSTTGDPLIVREESENGAPQTLLDTAALTGVSWPEHGTPLDTKVLTAAGGGWRLLVVLPSAAPPP